MKKVICLLLVFVCSLSLFACGNETAGNKEPEANPPAATPGQTPGTEKEPVDDKTPVSEQDKSFFLIIEKSKPNVITTRTITENIANNISFEGMIKTYVLANDATRTEYSYEKAREVSPDNIGNGMVEKVEGTIYYKDGLYSVDNVNWTVGYPDVNLINAKLDLSADNLGSYKLSADKTTLTTAISAADAEKILGIDIDDVVGTVAVTIVNNGTYLSKISVSYSTANAKVSLETTYTYEPIETTAQ